MSKKIAVVGGGAAGEGMTKDIMALAEKIDAYVGCTLMPPLFGLLAQHVSIALYPYYMLFFALLMLLMTERLRKIKQNA